MLGSDIGRRFGLSAITFEAWEVLMEQSARPIGRSHEPAKRTGKRSHSSWHKIKASIRWIRGHWPSENTWQQVQAPEHRLDKQ